MLPFYYLETPMMEGVKNDPWYWEFKKKAGIL
jgi:hypothetical protein